MEEQLYYRLCKGLVDKGKIIPIEENIYDHINNLEVDWYKSIFFYKQSDYKHITKIIKDENNKRCIQGVAGIDNVITNRLVFDFDNENDLECARMDAKVLCGRLISHGINQEAIQIYFSGNKGYGIEVNIDDFITQQEFKNITSGLAGDLATFDTKINNSSRIMRVPYSKHKGSNCYKIPLSLDELSERPSIDIKEEAKSKMEIYFPELWMTNISLPLSIKKLRKIKSDKVTPEMRSPTKPILDLTMRPKWLTNWKYAMQLGYFPMGCRNKALLILCATYKNNGFPKQIAYQMLQEVAKSQGEIFEKEPIDKKEIWITIINEVYGSAWKGGVFPDDNFPDELRGYFESIGLSKTKAEENNLIEISDVYATFERYATDIDKNTIKLGIPKLDSFVRVTTSMMVGLVGAPSSSKTSLAINFLSYLSDKDEDGLFYSLDMSAPTVYQRMAQKFTTFTPSQIFGIFKTGDEEKKKIIRESIEDGMKNVRISFRTALTVENIKDDLINYEENTGRKVRLIVIDYLECLSGPYADVNANMSIIAQKLKDLANELEVCVLILLQPQKMAGDPSYPLLSYRKIKGSSAIEQAASIVLSVWREGFNPSNSDNDRFISLAVVKNRMGTLGQVDCYWDGATGTVTELDDKGFQELSKLRRDNEEKRSHDNDF